MGKTQMKKFEVFDAKTGDLLATGTAKECAEILGITEGSFRNAAAWFESNGHSKYKIIELEGSVCSNKTKRTELLRAARAWDAFTEPIRRVYGIPVHGQEG